MKRTPIILATATAFVPSPLDRFIGWSPDGASYRVLRKANNEVPTTFAVEERAAVDGRLVFAGRFLWSPFLPQQPLLPDFPRVCLSPDARAVAVPPCPGFPARIVML